MAARKVEDLEGAELDYWVAKVEGHDWYDNLNHFIGYRESTPTSGPTLGHWYSVSWSQGGPLIEKYGIELRNDSPFDTSWNAMGDGLYGAGPTPLIALCRAIVAGKYGEEVNGN